MDAPAQKSSHVLTVVVAVVGLLSIGATIVVRFNTLENANDLRVSQIAELNIRCEKLENRMLSMERNSEIKDRIAELKSDVAVLNNKVDNISRRSR